MLLLRTVAILLGLGVAVSAALWIVTGERRWLGWSLKLVRVGVVVGLVFFGVLLLERIA
ncbi:MAG: hypothetical protein O9345_01355 [Burkholderiaceae bacterium]|nr:hypothetical protein [Burkholderiales bacterium]MCZ8103072.1 hypothetical protein [Burkholderiales bacterium]MCZ8336804.1 hypothetical protein [Burkholderiaceae bacterium]